jgi:hypothetical protein
MAQDAWAPDLLGSASQLLDEIVDQQINAAVPSDHTRQRLAGNRISCLAPQHPSVPTQLRRQILSSRSY